MISGTVSPGKGARDARAMWQLLEPIHAAIYFAPEAAAEYKRVGLEGFWMRYFASRAQALGAASPDVVSATFFNFAPEMVRRSLPDAWTLSTPEDVRAGRLHAADGMLSRLLAAVDDLVVDSRPPDLGARPIRAGWRGGAHG